MSKEQPAPFVTLTALLRRRFPGLVDPDDVVCHGLVLVDGAPASNPRGRVRADASIRLLRDAPLRGTVKLAHALRAFGLRVAGLAALDLGASAGGFTQALLDAGARRVYAVDVGFGQLRGSLRNDIRVVNLERTNLSQLDCELVGAPVDLVTIDLSYLPIADAVPQIDRQLLARKAQLVALVKPTYELRTSRLAARPEQVAQAVAKVQRALVDNGWRFIGQAPSPLPGSNGAVEAFVHAQRQPSHGGRTRPAS